MKNQLLNMILKNNRIKILLILLAVILVLSLATITVYAVTKTAEPKNFATEMFPDKYNMLLYIKNFKVFKSNFDNSELGRRFKNNYIYQDFKYKYFQSFDLFFVKLNFNIEKFFDLIQKDMAVGSYNNNFFVIASIDYKVKLIYSILNLLPGTQINETNYNNMIINSIYKSGETVYFIQIDKYIAIANKLEIIKVIIDAKIKKTNNPDTDIYKNLNDSELYYYTVIGEKYNNYNVFPDFKKVSFKVNAKNMNMEIFASPLENNNISFDSYSKDDLEILKVLPKDLTLCYYNRSYDIKSVIMDITSNIARRSKDDDDPQKLYKYIDSLDNYKKGAYFLFNSFGMQNGESNLSPEMGFIIKLKDSVISGEAKKNNEDVKALAGILFGVTAWEQVNIKDINLMVYYSRDNDFNLIFFNKYLIFCNNKNFTDNIIDKIKKQQSSLYDKYYDKLQSIDYNKMSSYICADMTSLSNAVEPLFNDYLSMNLNLNEDEYSKSFGDLFDYMRSSKPVYINLNYNKENGYYGKVETIQ